MHTNALFATTLQDFIGDPFITHAFVFVCLFKSIVDGQPKNKEKLNRKV